MQCVHKNYLDFGKVDKSNCAREQFCQGFRERKNMSLLKMSTMKVSSFQTT